MCKVFVMKNLLLGFEGGVRVNNCSSEQMLTFTVMAARFYSYQLLLTIAFLVSGYH